MGNKCNNKLHAISNMLSFQEGHAKDVRHTTEKSHERMTGAGVCCSMQLPQRFVLPFLRESHCGSGYCGIPRKQSPDVVCECALGIDGTEPIGYAAELGIKLEGMNVPVGNPRQSGLSRQFGHDGETAIPDTGMVSTLVSQDSEAGEPTAQNEMLRQSEILCHQVFSCVIGKVGVEFRYGAKRQDFKCLPGGREIWRVVFGKMFSDEVFLRTLDLTTYMGNVGLKTLSIFAQGLVCKPERVVHGREIANHLTAGGDFYLEDGIEDNLLQFCVETIDGNDVVEMGVSFEDMVMPVDLHRTPIVSQTEIARPVKDSRRLCLIVNNKPPLFQSFNLLSEGKGLFGIVHTEKRSPGLLHSS